MQELLLLRTLNFFLENPYEEFYLRELAKKLKISTFAVKKYADFLVKEDFIKEERKANLRYFKSNINSIFFKRLKMAYSINLIIKSGLINFLKENLSNTSSIVLFGSVAKGEDNKTSDIDILVIGNNKDISLSDFEEKLDKKINLHILSWTEWNKNFEDNKAFYFDVTTYGIALHGELPLVKWK